ncbi:hypothetical protein, variant [Verruconis gallopava]|uniref:RNB domain-containing protein n=1 Tax=Verruconis gallopava TaxID=253628 RepID=A0A0D2AR55_9PEZI|nr:uncharacterized protein PV09_00122 [Verruconis gallopava]XP_016219062.1 hypothetical protein, variant [Verruconis gallopava]KIW09192.1 hypothetical protein PV09_00122 [Verruconis gallopava]KIW09193.1 hypothetical protein, variant [Verruconis gallopava]
MPSKTAQVRHTSIYTRLCWECIANVRSIAAAGHISHGRLPRYALRLSTGRSHRNHVRAFHHGGVRRQELETAKDSNPASGVPTDVVLPIRQRLARWQEENGNPMSDLLGLDKAFGVRNVVADTYGEPKEGMSADSDRDNDAEDLPPSLYDQAISEYGGMFLQMGDLVEIESSRAHAPPTICVFVRRLSSQQIQLITMRGKWLAVVESSIRFSVPGFLDKKLVEPIVPYLPDAEVIEEVLGQTHILDPSVPRTITAPVVTALNDFSRQSEEVYRKHASVLDNAHDLLAHPTDLRFGTLDRVTDRLIGKDSSAPRMPAMYAVRKALLTARLAFGIDRRSHRTTGVFQIRSKKQLKYVAKAVQWLREYQEWEISRIMNETSEKTRLGHAKLTIGVRIVQGFVRKAREAIIESRKHRSAKYVDYGAVGPSSERFPINSPEGTIRFKPTVKFTESERVLIRVLEYASVQCIIEHDEPLNSLIPLILRGTGMYSEPPYDVELGKRAIYSFLLEIGVFAPYDDLTLYDVNLLLPNSQHSKPLQQLASTLSQMKASNVDLQDSFADLRKDLNGTVAFAIDDAGAHEIDDAISVSRITGTDSRVWIHVHVANPTAFISRDSTFARMAAHLTETFYSPERTIPLLPSWLTDDMFSLTSGRPCLTVSTLVDEHGNVLDVKIEHGKLGKVVHLDYKQLPAILDLEVNETKEMEPLVIGGDLPASCQRHAPEIPLEHKDDLKLIYKIAQARFALRQQNGGFNYAFSQPSISVHSRANKPGLPDTYPHRAIGIRTEGDPIIAIYPRKFRNPFSDMSCGSDILVTEMMLLAGESFAKWCEQRGIPIMYRTMQSEPGGPSYHEAYAATILPSIEQHGHITIGAGFRFLQQAGKGMMMTTVSPHPNLGLDAYVKATSPLRRYGDMVVHWQVEAALREEALSGHSSLINSKREDYLPYSRSQIEKIIERLHPRERLIATSKQRSVRHWISHWFFRAHYFNEYPLPKTIQVVVLRQAQSLTTTKQANNLAAWIETGVNMKIRPQDADGNLLQFGDIWEAEIDAVVPYYPDTILRPLRLLYREE